MPRVNVVTRAPLRETARPPYQRANPSQRRVTYQKIKFFHHGEHGVSRRRATIALHGHRARLASVKPRVLLGEKQLNLNFSVVKSS